ncbi:hypothetical protein Tco_0573372 [Tanacetum coccineum]
MWHRVKAALPHRFPTALSPELGRWPIVVHAQQKFGYEKPAGLLDFGKFRVLPRRSVAYERLSPVVEAEMTSGVDRDRKEVDIE